MPRELHDHYFRMARREGYLSRAAYKLIEIDERKHVLRSGDRVLDCGSAPGSWLQVASRRVGPTGVVVGIDLRPIRPPPGTDNVRVIEGDVHEVEPADLLAAARGTPDGRTAPFDVVLSDMAPSTSGEASSDHHRSVRLCAALLDRLPRLLRRDGRLVMKVFEGEAYPDLLARVRAGFEHAKGYKPPASRSISCEIYLIASGFRPSSAPPPDPPPSPPPPTRGWGR